MQIFAYKNHKPSLEIVDLNKFLFTESLKRIHSRILVFFTGNLKYFEVLNKSSDIMELFGDTVKIVKISFNLILSFASLLTDHIFKKKYFYSSFIVNLFSLFCRS